MKPALPPAMRPALSRLTPVLLMSSLLAGCGGATAFRGGDSSEGGGISTTAVGRAQNTQIDQNDSLPLSQQNSAEAIAAREANRSNGLEAGSATAASAAPRAAASPAAPRVAATPPAGSGSAVVASTNPHDKVAGFTKGAKVHVRNGAALYARPSTASESVLAVATPELVELGPQVYNAGGFWYYVVVGKETGWLSQADLLP